MSSVAIERMQFVQRKSPPDFSFPPKYPANREVVSPRPRSRVPPNFGFPIHKPEAPQAVVKPALVQDTVSAPSSLPPLLRLPLEIRLQIYADVLSSHPIFHAHLAPPPASSPNPDAKVHRTPISQPLGHSLPSTSVLTAAQQKIVFRAYPLSTSSLVRNLNTSNQNIRQQNLSQGKIPTGLLASCKQIYEETRMLPWEQNTFSFINWFWSGVYASRQFTRGLREWQCDGMRWVGVEVLTRDLVSSQDQPNGKIVGRTDFVELCGMWKGVWGLRLGIKGSIRGKERNSLPQNVVAEGLYARPGDLPQKAFKCQTDKGLLDVNCQWVTEGLTALSSLKWIEVEIEDKDAEREEKMQFCGELDELLNAGRLEGEGRTKVALVEKEEGGVVVGDRNFMWFGGMPMNENEG